MGLKILFPLTTFPCRKWLKSDQDGIENYDDRNRSMLIVVLKSDQDGIEKFSFAHLHISDSARWNQTKMGLKKINQR